MGSWTHIHLEAYCMFGHASSRRWRTVDLKGNTSIQKNKNYIPKNKRPSWCKKQNKKRIPQYRCLAIKCPFFAFCNANKKDYKLFDKAYNEKYKRK